MGTFSWIANLLPLFRCWQRQQLRIREVDVRVKISTNKTIKGKTGEEGPRLHS
jgi:hypothetical protein